MINHVARHMQCRSVCTPAAQSFAKPACVAQVDGFLEPFMRKEDNVKRLLVSILAASLWFKATGCGTIFQGTHQTVPISVAPPGTEVSVYRWSGEVVGGPQLSPGELTIQRPNGSQPYYLVRASKDGYCPKYWLTTRSYTGGTKSYLWAAFVPFLDIVALPLLFFDTWTGGCCNVEPDSFDGVLAEEQTGCGR